MEINCACKFKLVSDLLCVTLNSNLGFIELDDRRGGARTGGRKGRGWGKVGGGKGAKGEGCCFHHLIAEEGML